MFPSLYDRSFLPFSDPSMYKRVGYRSIHPDFKKLRILIIDGDEDVAGAEKFILEILGFPEWKSKFKGLQVWAVSRVTMNYKNLIRAIQATKPHLILSDTMHRGRNGFESTHYIHTQIRPEIPVIIVSARTEETDIIKGFGMGARDYILKPFEPDDFICRVFGLLDKIGHERLCEMWE